MSTAEPARSVEGATAAAPAPGPGVLIEVDELAAAMMEAAAREYAIARSGDDGADATPPLTILDVRWTLGGPSGEPEYRAGHVPGARWVDLEAALSSRHEPGRTGRHPLPDPAVFGAAMRRLGVRPERPVVVYDAATSLAAARLWWLLTDAGHPSVRVLNGGFAAWQEAGEPMATGTEPPTAAGDFVPAPGRRATVTAADLVERARAGFDVGSDGPPDSAAARREGRAGPLVDVRAPERFSGELEPVDPVAGHIPGAVNLPSMSLLADGFRFASTEELRQRLATAGVNAATSGETVLYCGSGITAAHALLGMEAAGLGGAAIYPGSWSDWITDAARPVATGAG